MALDGKSFLAKTTATALLKAPTAASTAQVNVSSRASGYTLAFCTEMTGLPILSDLVFVILGRKSMCLIKKHLGKQHILSIQNTQLRIAKQLVWKEWELGIRPQTLYFYTCWVLTGEKWVTSSNPGKQETWSCHSGVGISKFEVTLPCVCFCPFCFTSSVCQHCSGYWPNSALTYTIVKIIIINSIKVNKPQWD